MVLVIQTHSVKGLTSEELVAGDWKHDILTPVSNITPLAILETEEMTPEDAEDPGVYFVELVGQNRRNPKKQAENDGKLDVLPTINSGIIDGPKVAVK